VCPTPITATFLFIQIPPIIEVENILSSPVKGSNLIWVDLKRFTIIDEEICF
jgi:hypothetical protein